MGVWGCAPAGSRAKPLVGVRGKAPEAERPLAFEHVAEVQNESHFAYFVSVIDRC